MNMLIKITRAIFKVFYGVFFDLTITGEENFPVDEGFVICPNHNSQHDPLVLGAGLNRIVYAMAKKELFKYKISNWFFSNINTIPVDRDNMDISVIKKSLRLLKREKEGLIIFAEGTRNFGDKALEVKPGVAMLATKAKVPIVPVSIDSTYRLFSPINVTVHEPIYLDEYYDQRNSTETYQQITQEIMDDIYDSLSLYKLRQKKKRG